MVRKILVVVASRANWGRLKSVCKAIDEHPQLELQLIVGASALLDKYGCVDIIEKDFTIDEKIYTVVEGATPGCMSRTTGYFMAQLSQSFERLKPDIVFCHADRYEMLAVAATAAYMNIPLVHSQGGEVTGSIDDKVRNAITNLADIHFPATEQSKQRIIDMGISPDTVFNVGCPSIDIIPKDLTITEDFNAKYGGVGKPIDLSQPYLVVCQHPVTTEYGEGFKQINETLKAIKALNMPTVWLWPNVDAGTDDISKGLRMAREQSLDNVHFFKNLSPEDFYKLIYNCKCLIGNTSSGIRESNYLGVPFVCVGSRQNQREHGLNATFVIHTWHEIKYAVELETGRYEPDYRFGKGDAGKQIAERLANI
jgi:UDP-hydrolysing UDP-N-acetyl-D-glucosamine 2-epimerase